MSYEQCIDSAIAWLQSQEKHNYSEAARRYNVKRTTVERRFQGKTTSRAEANSEYQLLTTTQEKTPIDRINRLTNRNMAPTSQIKNIAEEIRGGWLIRTGLAI